MDELKNYIEVSEIYDDGETVFILGKPKTLKLPSGISYSEPIPDFYTWDEEIYMPEDINDIADNLWKLREDIMRWQFYIDVPDDVVNLLLLNDRRKIYFQLKDWNFERRKEVVRFIEWFEEHFASLEFWKPAIEKFSVNPFGKDWLFKYNKGS